MTDGIPLKRPSGEEAARVLRHVIGRIRHHWSRVEIAVRGDGHYGTPEVIALLEDQGCCYILGLPGNARLSEIGQPWCEDAALRRVQSGKDIRMTLLVDENLLLHLIDALRIFERRSACQF